MTTESSSQVVEPSPENLRRPPQLSHRVVAFMVIWLFGWPVFVYAYLPLAHPPATTLEIFLFCAGGLVWCGSGIGIFGTLINMVEARWPAMRPVLKALGFLFGILRAFGGHHSS
jgi:hypothetical protein